MSTRLQNTIQVISIIYTDASRSGWDAVCKTEVTSGSWSTFQLPYKFSRVTTLRLSAVFIEC